MRVIRWTRGRWTHGLWTLWTHPSFLGLHACNKMDAWPMDAWPMDDGRVGGGLVHQFSDEGPIHQFPHAKKSHGMGTDRKKNNGHRDSMIESAQWADSMKIFGVASEHIYLSFIAYFDCEPISLLYISCFFPRFVARLYSFHKVYSATLALFHNFMAQLYPSLAFWELEEALCKIYIL